MARLLCASLLTSACLLGMIAQAAQDVTKPGDIVVGYPNDSDWPANELPGNAIDNNVSTKYLHFKGDFQPNVGPTGFCVTPTIGPTVVTGLTFTTANDYAGRDPTGFELSGSNETIDGPYTRIAKRPIVDFAGPYEWPRLTKNATPIQFSNKVAYRHYRVLFIDIRGPVGENVNSMQIAEVELLTGTEKAINPYPANGAIGVGAAGVFKWTGGYGAKSHSVYLGTSPNLTAGNLRVSGSNVTYYSYFGLLPGVKYYWRVDEVVDRMTTYTGDVWSFTTESLSAYGPEPADGSVALSPVPVLRWRAPADVVLHQVYFSNNFADVYTGAVSANAGQASSTVYEPGALHASTTYYWRVDEMKSKGSTVPGTVWSFTMAAPVRGKIVRQWWSNIAGTYVEDLTVQAKYPNYPTGSERIDRFEGPIDWDDNYGSRLCGWLIPPESGWYTFWIASDDCSQLWLSTNADPRNIRLIAEVRGWVSPQYFDFAPDQKSPVMKLQAGQKYFIQALMKEGSVNDNIAVAWQPPTPGRNVIDGSYVDTFAFEPVQAFSPKPADRATDIIQTPTLSWSAGDKAQQHEIYFGQDRLAVATATPTSSLFKERQSGTIFNPGALEWNETYYWRVDEINSPDPNSPWIGSIWSFTTANFWLVDDFEGYTDDPGRRIKDSWTDGGMNGTGAGVGYPDPPSAERTIVRQGKQSMPFAYDNTVEPYYSETARTFANPQDWTINGVGTLTLYVRGRPDNSSERLYVMIEDSAGKAVQVVNSDASVLLAGTWNEWKIPLSGLKGANLAKVKKLYLGIGNRSKPVAGGTGTIYIDDIRVTKP